MKKYLQKKPTLISFILFVAITTLVFSNMTAAIEQTDINDIYTLKIYKSVTKVNKSAPAVDINSYTYMTDDERPIEVQYSFPNNPDFSNLVICIVMPGVDRDINGSYMRSFSYLSMVENICVITPKFAKEDFPTSEYQYVNISSKTQYEEWTFNKIDSLFQDFVKKFKLNVDKYILYGHSAGAQFAHRTAIFSESEYIDYVIAASAGTYTFLDESKNYSSGIKKLMDYKNTILSNLNNRKLYILTGNEDNDPNAENFIPSEQGNTRHEKALNFYSSTLNYAIENKTYYNWETLIMDSVGHSSKQTIPYVLDIITGKYKSQTERINAKIEKYNARYYNTGNLTKNTTNTIQQSAS